MSSVQIKSKIELDAILEGIAQLDTADLEQFQQQVNRLLAQRKAPSLSKAEAALLLKINEGLPQPIQARYAALSEKIQEETISSAEHEEWLQLNEQVEAKDAERLELLIELAELRNISVDELITQLEI